MAYLGAVAFPPCPRRYQRGNHKEDRVNSRRKGRRYVVDALAFLRSGFDGDANAVEYDLYYAVVGAPNTVYVTGTSTLYRANPVDGSAAVVDGEPWGVVGEIFEATPGDIGETTGMAFIGSVQPLESAGFPSAGKPVHDYANTSEFHAAL